MLLVGTTEGKKSLERPNRRWVDNIKMDLGDIGWGGMDWICLTEDEPSGSIKFWETIEWFHNWWPLE
jgi:hypothetical protein